MADCLFCRIVRKEIPAQIVHETTNTLAFRDIKPGAPVHMLVIPKEHVPSLLDWKSEHASLIGEIHQTVRKVAELEKIAERGFRLVVNNGSDAGQAVLHVHYHVLAGRSLAWPPG